MKQEQKKTAPLWCIVRIFGGSGATSSEQQKICTVKTQYKVRNKYSQERNCAASVSISMPIHVSVSDLYISMIGLPILLKENM
jgi:hypothetical protein